MAQKKLSKKLNKSTRRIKTLKMKSKLKKLVESAVIGFQKIKIKDSKNAIFIYKNEA